MQAAGFPAHVLNDGAIKTNAPSPFSGRGDVDSLSTTPFPLREEQWFGCLSIAESKGDSSTGVRAVLRRFPERLRQHYFRGPRKALPAQANDLLAR